MVTFNTPDMEAYTKLLTALINEISITETQFENLLKSYGAVGKYLEEDPRLDGYSPIVFPARLFTPWYNHPASGEG